MRYVVTETMYTYLASCGGKHQTVPKGTVVELLGYQEYTHNGFVDVAVVVEDGQLAKGTFVGVIKRNILPTNKFWAWLHISKSLLSVWYNQLVGNKPTFVVWLIFGVVIVTLGYLIADKIGVLLTLLIAGLALRTPQPHDQHDDHFFD